MVFTEVCLKYLLNSLFQWRRKKNWISSLCAVQGKFRKEEIKRWTFLTVFNFHRDNSRCRKAFLVDILINRYFEATKAFSFVSRHFFQNITSAWSWKIKFQYFNFSSPNTFTRQIQPEAKPNIIQGSRKKIFFFSGPAIKRGGEAGH